MPVDSVKAPRLRNIDPIERDMADVDVIFDVSQELTARPDSGMFRIRKSKTFQDSKLFREVDTDTWR